MAQRQPPTAGGRSAGSLHVRALHCRMLGACGLTPFLAPLVQVGDRQVRGALGQAQRCRSTRAAGPDLDGHGAFVGRPPAFRRA
jgi:hypothetical protein